jgi:probable rRNA maturation factor
MTLSVDVVDPGGLVADHDAVRGLVEAVLSAEGIAGEVSVAFVDEATMADLNGRYRDADGPTDVLSFDYSGDCSPPPASAAPPASSGTVGSGAGVSGEIVVCPEVVARYAAEEDREPAVQMGWTIIHGVLHLAGYDHETDHGEMRAREQHLLGRLHGAVRALSLSAGG